MPPLPEDFETCATGSRNLLELQAQRIDQLASGLRNAMKSAIQSGDEKTYGIARQVLVDAGMSCDSSS